MIGCSANKATTLKDPKIDMQAGSSHQLVSAKTANEYLYLAKVYEDKKNYEMAIIANQKALQIEPNNTKGLTGLATAYAAQNLLTVAIPLFEKVVALDGNAKHYSNLGYAYYLNQQYEEAKRVLNQAILLEPDYQQAKHNLALVDTNYKAEQEVKLLSKTEKDVDYVVINSTKTENIISNQVDTNPTSTDLVVINSVNEGLQASSSGIYELNFPSRIENPVVPAIVTTDNQANSPSQKEVNNGHELIATLSGGITLKHMPVVTKLFDLATTGVISLQLTSNNQYMEVINGNGLKGVARTVASQLADRGIEKIKVADAKKFNISKTHIQYRSGYRDDAVSLNHNLLNRPYLLRNDNLPADTKIRLVLGRDLMLNLNQAELNALSSLESST